METNFNPPAVDTAALENIGKSGKWMHFLAVLMLILAALVGLGSLLFTGAQSGILMELSDRFPQFESISRLGSFLVVLFIIVALFVFFQGYLLLKASQGAKAAVSGDLDQSLNQYANHYRNYLILTVVFGALGIIGSIFTLITIN